MKIAYLLLAGMASCCVGAGIGVAQTDAPGGIASFTAAQAVSGQQEYTANCVDCHGRNLNDGEFGGPPLKGEVFRRKWFGRPASGLVGYMRGAMPPDSPGRLPIDTYVEIAAYLMSQNSLAPGDKPMPTDMPTLGKLRLGAEGGGQ